MVEKAGTGEAMITRKQFLDGQATLDEYYQQFITDAGRAWVIYTMGRDRLLKSKDKSFNDIPLALWDLYPFTPGERMRAAGDFPTLAGAVCIAKTIARQLVEQERTQ